MSKEPQPIAAEFPLHFKSNELHARVLALCCIAIWLITLSLCLPALKQKDLLTARAKHSSTESHKGHRP